jgi:hypothetical protein
MVPPEGKRRLKYSVPFLSVGQYGHEYGLNPHFVDLNSKKALPIATEIFLHQMQQHLQCV